MTKKTYSAWDLDEAMLVDGRSNVLQDHNTPLTDSEIRCINELLPKCAGRPFTAKQLYRDHWDSIRGPRKFGRRFKASVRAGTVPQLRNVGRNSSKSQLYVALPDAHPLPDASNSTSVAIMEEDTHAV